MILTKTPVFLMALCFGVTGAYAADYYVSDCQPGADADCVAGNDANGGTSPAEPWRTVEKAQSFWQGAPAGTKIHFARGGFFAVTNPNGPGGDGWTNFNCTGESNPCKADPCVVTDYIPPWASGDEGKPVLSNPSGSVFLFANGGWALSDGGYEVRNVEMRGGGTGYGVWARNDVDDLLMDKVVIDGFDRGLAIGNSNYPGPSDPPLPAGTNGLSERISLTNSSIVNNAGQGILGGSDDGLIQNNLFENNGFDEAIFNHNIYLSGNGTGTEGAVKNMRVIGNSLYRSTMVDGMCQGVSLVVHGKMEDLLIEGNLIREDVGAVAGSCWGIAVDAGYGYREFFTRTVIRNNKVVNAGGLSISVSACTDCVIENNVVLQNQNNGSTAILAPNSNAGEGDDGTLDNLTVRNNSIYFNSDGGTGIGIAAQGSSHTVVSNAVYFARSGGNFSCLNLPLPGSSYEAVDNNLCDAAAPGSFEWESGSGALASWQAASGFDGSSLQTDPLYTDAGDGNLTPQAGSPLIDNGHPTLSAPLDLQGSTRDSAPDIGAIEMGLPVGVNLPEVVGDRVFSVSGRVVFRIPASFETLTLYDLRGHRILSFPVRTDAMDWNGRDASGRSVKKGVYFARLQGERKTASFYKGACWQ